jgi:hypothetical protein
MYSHQALPKFAVVRDKEMEQFVNNHIISKFTIEIHELGIEAEVAL